MATIDSLDLATLTNNPQSIAEALEDVLETTNGNIASLKQTAQTDQEYISNTLKPSAQSDHDAIEDLLVDLTPTKHQYTTLLNSWTAWDQSSATSSDHGVTVQNMGKIWIVQVAMYNGGISIGEGTSNIVDISNEFTTPSGTVILGGNHFGNTGQDDYTVSFHLLPSGILQLLYRNGGGSGHHVFSTHVGFDCS